LKKTDGTIINEINYSDDWYDDENYDDGAWSLEIIDPLNFCGENDNWTVSIDPSGGTPGKENSVNASNPDNTAPELIAVKIIASNYLLLEFDENISEGARHNQKRLRLSARLGVVRLRLELWVGCVGVVDIHGRIVTQLEGPA
jgi:hypothetical protein